MKILVTGAKGFVGKNLCTQLNNIRTGKAKWYNITIDEVFEYDINSDINQLAMWCKECDFVFHLAGVNRPTNSEEFMSGNFAFTNTLLDTLIKAGNKCPVMISSSIQASLSGRFGNSEYGQSKKAGEELIFAYSKETGANVLVYRLPNLFGKWCKPNYNSAVATFCYNIANDMPIHVNDPSVRMELLYIDDLVEELIGALSGNAHRCEFDGVKAVPDINGKYCFSPNTHHTTLGEIVNIIYNCAKSINTVNGGAQLALDMPRNSLQYKIMSTYLSYLPKNKLIHDINMKIDNRGSFTELFHSLNCGQVSINVCKPGITKGQHWHHSKWETFVVVAGHGLIMLRPENPDPDQLLGNGNAEIIKFEVSCDKIQAVHMIPGYTHKIVNTSKDEDLVTIMYSNEVFDPNRPDTYSDNVE